jgi:hypothetical protein
MGRSLGTIRELSDSNPEALVWPDPQRGIDGIDFPKIVVTKGLSERSSAQKNQFAFEPACLLARFWGLLRLQPIPTTGTKEHARNEVTEALQGHRTH